MPAHLVDHTSLAPRNREEGGGGGGGVREQKCRNEGGAPPPNAALEPRNPNGAKSSDETDAKTEAARAEGAGESGGGAAAADAKTRSRVASTPRAPDAKGESPLFSPVGGVTAAFAAAALMPSAGDRGALPQRAAVECTEPPV